MLRRHLTNHTEQRANQSCFHLTTLFNFTLLFVLLFQIGCSQQAPPPPPPQPVAAAPEPKPEQKAPKKKPELSREERVKAIALNKFELYERKIKVADFPRAEAALRDMRAVFDLEVDYQAFWEESIPSAKRIILTLMSLCEVCKDGSCPTCKGESKCEICKGKGKCGNCDARPIRKQECRACVCKGCSGTGKCRTCGGFKNKKCIPCSGYGGIGGSTRAECRRCGGVGARPGLKGPKGVSSVKCLTCRGTGKVPQRVVNACTACGGKGRTPCVACSGAGRCATCTGSGRAASCSICGGARSTVHKCPQCDGTGKCVKCTGTGHCTICHGSGKCFECDGGLVRLYDFPVNAKWMKMKEGHVLFDSRLNKIVDKGEKPGFKEIEYKDLKLSLIINKGQIIFIATQPAFDPAVEIIRR